MSRYFTARHPKSLWVADDDIWSDGETHLPTVSDPEATDTGLLDAKGEIIWRAPNPVGFGRDEDW